MLDERPPARTFPPFAACPTCGHLAIHDVTQDHEGIREAYYLCDQGHGWSMRWLAVA